jgi:hypothetical protein
MSFARDRFKTGELPLCQKSNSTKLIASLSGRVGGFIFYDEADGQNLSRTMPEVTAELTEKPIRVGFLQTSNTRPLH